MVLCGSGDRINMERAATEQAATPSRARFRFRYPIASQRRHASVNMLSPLAQVYTPSLIRRGKFGLGESTGTDVSVTALQHLATLLRESRRAQIAATI